MTSYKLPLVLTPQPEGGYTITCPVLPELLTETDNLDEVNAHVADALAAVLEIYQETGRSLPPGLVQPLDQGPVWTETVIQLPCCPPTRNLP